MKAIRFTQFVLLVVCLMLVGWGRPVAWSQTLSDFNEEFDTDPGLAWGFDPGTMNTTTRPGWMTWTPGSSGAFSTLLFNPNGGPGLDLSAFPLPFEMQTRIDVPDSSSSWVIGLWGSPGATGSTWMQFLFSYNGAGYRLAQNGGWGSDSTNLGIPASVLQSDVIEIIWQFTSSEGNIVVNILVKDAALSGPWYVATHIAPEVSVFDPVGLAIEERPGYFGWIGGVPPPTQRTYQIDYIRFSTTLTPLGPTPTPTPTPTPMPDITTLNVEFDSVPAANLWGFQPGPMDITSRPGWLTWTPPAPGIFSTFPVIPGSGLSLTNFPLPWQIYFRVQKPENTDSWAFGIWAYAGESGGGAWSQFFTAYSLDAGDVILMRHNGGWGADANPFLFSEGALDPNPLDVILQYRLQEETDILVSVLVRDPNGTNPWEVQDFLAPVVSLFNPYGMAIEERQAYFDWFGGTAPVSPRTYQFDFIRFSKDLTDPSVVPVEPTPTPTPPPSAVNEWATFY